MRRWFFFGSCDDKVPLRQRVVTMRIISSRAAAVAFDDFDYGGREEGRSGEHCSGG